MLGDALEQLLRRLDHPVVAHQIASAEHRKGVVGERRQHVRTVRSAAWSRNRPRRRLAWLLLVILLVLVALAARVDAASSEASIALAVHHADVLTGVDDPEDSAATAADHEADGAGADADQADADQAAEAGADDLADADDADAADAHADATDTAAPELGDPDASAPEMGAPEAHRSLAYDAEQAAAGAILGDDAILGASPAGAIETYEASMRHLRPSRWGRLDLGLSWRRRWSEPMHARPSRLDEVWLVATWRR